MTCTCGCLSPFRWAEYPRNSIFVADFGRGAHTGMTQSQMATRTVTTFEKTRGYSLGTVGGLSAKADKETAQRNDQRRLVRQAKRA